MTEGTKSIGKTTIAPEVLLTIIKLTTLDVDGVDRFASVPGRVDAFLKRGVEEGIHINVENGIVYADLHLIINHDYHVRDVSRAVQCNVARAISEMVGMEPGKINIHVEDINYKIRSENHPS